jgi:diguanylate cyclase (GGDEF)-like protein
VGVIVQAAPGVRATERRDDEAPANRAAVIAAIGGLVGIAMLDLVFSNLHLGALAVVPLLVIAYYTRPVIALAVAVAIAPLFAAFDHDWLALIPVPHGAPVDAVILGIMFVAVVLLVDRLRRRDLAHARLRADYEHMRTLAERDRLTDLPNRATFFERLSGLLLVAERAGDRHGVLFFDLDGFKAVNDRYGHAVGDRLLLMVGERLKTMLRDFGIVARVGGDEFAAIVEHVRDHNDLERVGYRIEQALALPFVVGRRDLSLGVSVGCSLYPDDADDADTLLTIADAAMYEAKRSKRP